VPGGHYAPVELDLYGMYGRGATFHTGVANARAYIRPLFDLLQTGRITPQIVMGTPQAIEDAAEALAEPSLKPVFVRSRYSQRHLTRSRPLSRRIPARPGGRPFAPHARVLRLWRSGQLTL
jgi:hypothetical protein